MEEKTVSKIMEEVIEEICDKYCKFPTIYEGKDEDELYDKHCDKCPLNRL